MEIYTNTPQTTFGMAFKNPKGRDLKKMNAYFRRECADTLMHKMAFKRFKHSQSKLKYVDIYFRPGYKQGMVQANDAFIVSPKKGVWGGSVEVPCVPQQYDAESQLDRIFLYHEEKHKRFLETHPAFRNHKVLKSISFITYTLKDSFSLAVALLARPNELLPNSLRQAGLVAKKMNKEYKILKNNGVI